MVVWALKLLFDYIVIMCLLLLLIFLQLLFLFVMANYFVLWPNPNLQTGSKHEEQDNNEKTPN